MAEYDGNISESATGSLSYLPNTKLGVVQYANGIAISQLAAAYGITVNASAILTGALSYGWTAGPTVSERAKATGTFAPSLKFSMTVQELASVHGALSVALPIAISEGASISDALTTVAALFISEKAKASATTLTQSQINGYIQELAQAFSIYGALANANVNEGATGTASLVAQYALIASMTEHALLQQLDAENIVVSMAVLESADATDTELVKAVYSGDAIIESAIISVAYCGPDNTTTTWVMNTRTNALTQYVNWAFNSFASMGRKYIGAAADGLYELDGERDNTTNISAYIAGGLTQMNGAKFAGLKGVYMGVRGQGDYLLKLVTGDGREYIYAFVSQPNFMTTKVRTGKGLRSRYIQWELISNGPDFDLDTIEFVPMISDRRV